MAPRRISFSLNPLWNHYVAFASLLCALMVGLFRYGLIDRVDPLHCQALLSRGRWLDNKFQNWEPDGCMLYQYQKDDVTSCLGSKRVVFIGDSVTRQLFFQFAHSIDPTLPTGPPNNEQKHQNYSFESIHSLQLAFYWDPFLNSSVAQSYMRGTSQPQRPALLVLGSGLWYLRHPDSGGLPAWESMMESTLETLSRVPSGASDTVVILPIEDVISSKLSPDRAATMHASDIDAMNSDLSHRIRPPAVNDPFAFASTGASEAPYITFPSVFNQMVDPSQTEDGLHFSNAVVTMQARLLLNLRCNDVLPKVFPLDKTCCRSYPWPSLLHLLLLIAVLSWGPIAWYKAKRYSNKLPSDSIIPPEAVTAVIISGSVAAIYLADRTGFWLKGQKQFSPYTFTFLCFVSLAVGLLTVKRTENDLGFLNRDQTDEWKGWMQVAILIYHYTGASKISGIYNPIRVLVASYLFMTGYGHATYYLKKADFSFLRVAQVLIRLNLFTLILAYAMNTDYISYYFSPLVSWWYLIIYGTMLMGSQYNDRATFVIPKIVLSSTLVRMLMRTDWLLEYIFTFLERVFAIRWSAREWAFRVNLDIDIVYWGMFAALAVIKFREHRIADHPRWSLVVKASAAISGVILLLYLAFEVQFNKFDYNLMHPAVSVLPVGAFIILRNASAVLRSASSRAFAFVGKCSLETFVIQYHLWLAGDTKGILLVFPGTRWRALNMVLTTIIFIYVSDQVARATGELTKWLCSGGDTTPSLPTTAPTVDQARSASSTTDGVQEIIFLAPADEVGEGKDGENSLPPEPDTPVRPLRRWADRLAEGTQPPTSRVALLRSWEEWQPGVKTKLVITLLCMWVLNIMWTYPSAPEA